MASTYLYRFAVAGEVFRYTSNSSNVVVDLGDGDETFVASSIYGTEFRSTFSDSESTINMPDTLRPASDYVLGAPNSRVLCRVYDLEGNPVFAGKVANCTFDVDKRIAKLSVRPWTMQEATAPNRFLQPGCAYNLGDSRCLVNIEALAVVGTGVTVSSDGLTITSTAWGAEDDGYFTGGFLQLGQEYSLIVSHVGNTLGVMRRFRATSGVYTARPGCDKSATTCNVKFNNIDNFGGFDKIPGFNPSARSWA